MAVSFIPARSSPLDGMASQECEQPALFLANSRQPWYTGDTFALWSGILVQARARKGFSAVGAFASLFVTRREEPDLARRTRRTGYSVLSVQDSALQPVTDSGGQSLCWR